MYLLTLLFLSWSIIAQPSNKTYIALGFDDYHIENWAGYLDFFNQKNVKATFFIGGEVSLKHYPSLLKFVESGHEIALHGINHSEIKGNTDLNSYFSKEIEPQINQYISLFKKKSNSFAYPFGAYTAKSNELYKDFFAVLRGYMGGLRKTKKEVLGFNLTSEAQKKRIESLHFIPSIAIDYVYTKTEAKAYFKFLIESMKGTPGIFSIATHKILPKGPKTTQGLWAIYEDDLEYFIDECNKAGFIFIRTDEIISTLKLFYTG